MFLPNCFAAQLGVWSRDEVARIDELAGLSSIEPDDSSREVDCGEEISGRFVVAGGDGEMCQGRLLPC
jgi:hypothetical protein